MKPQDPPGNNLLCLLAGACCLLATAAGGAVGADRIVPAGGKAQTQDAPRQGPKDRAIALSQEGVALYRQRRHEEALARFQGAVDAYRELYGGQDHPDLAASLNNLGSCLHALGRLDKALAVHRQALAMDRRLHPSGDYPGLATSLNNLAFCLDGLGRSGEALPLYQQALEMYRRLHPNGDHPAVAAALNNVASCLDNLGRSVEALPLYQQALAMRKRLSGGRDHPDVAQSLTNLASCLNALGGSGKALPLCREALAMRRRLHADKDHPDVTASLGNLASCLDYLDRSGEALPLHRQALAMCQRLYPGQDHPDTAASLGNLASCLHCLSRWDEALPLFRQALEMRRRLHKGADHPAVAKSLCSVAFCLKALGRFGEALGPLEQALAMRRRLGKDKDHPDVADSLGQVALCLCVLGRAQEALPLYRQAFEMRKRLHGDKDHPDVALCLNGVAYCLRDLGRPGEALPLYRQALEMQRRLYRGKDHADLATGMGDLAICLDDLGRSDDALGHHQQALAMFQRLHGDTDNPHLATSLNSLALCLDRLGRAGEALPLFERTLAIHNRLHKGQDHPDSARSLNNLAFCLNGLGRAGDALPLYQQALAMALRLHTGRDHPEVTTGLCNLASCLAGLGRPGEALPLCQRALEMHKRLHADRDHPDVAANLNNLAACLNDLGRPREALPIYRQALEMNKRLADGQDHPIVAWSLNNLAHCLDALGRSPEALPLYQQALAMAERLRNPDAFRLASNVGWLYLRDLDRPAEAAKAFDKAILGMEQARLVLGGTDLDRARYFGHIAKWGAFGGMVRAQLRLGHPDRALEYLERGRALGLREVLERGQRLKGGDLLGLVEAQVRAAGGNAERLREIAAARTAERAALSRVSTLTAQVQIVRARKDLAQADRAKQVEALTAELGQAQEAHVSARRVVFNLAAQYAVQELKPLAAPQMQALLEPRQRLLVYAIGEKDSAAFLVPPAGGGGEIRAFRLTWPGPHQKGPEDLTAKTLADAVSRYVQAMRCEGLLSRGADWQRLSDEELADRGLTRSDVSGHSAAEHGRLGYRLFQALVPADLWRELKGCELVYVVRDGDLHRLPLEALVVAQPADKADAEARRYWLDDGPPVAYGPSAAVLVQCCRRRQEQRQQLAQYGPPKRQATLLGDPIFQRSQAPGAPVPQRGVAVMRVRPDSPAERLGLRAGAVITAYGGREVAGVADLDKARTALFTELMQRRLKATPKLAFWQAGSTLERELSPKETDLGVTLADLDAALRGRLSSPEPLDASVQVALAERSGYLSRYGALRPLPGTRREIGQIYRTLTGRDATAPQTDGNVAVLLAEDATRTKLSALAPGSRYVHLATHGLLDTSSSAIYSSLALTQPRPGEVTNDDFGFLTLVDLLDHWWGKLAGTELVVLSACDTQRGRIEAGEGVFGIWWGFMYAGSPSVIASLWPVSDASTAELMADLYARLQAAPTEAAPVQGGQDNRDAKLRAFVAARRALRIKHPQPYFWAPFIYMGDPR